MTGNEQTFKEILEQDPIDIAYLKQECRNGIPSGLRSRIYKILMLGLGSEYSDEREKENVRAYDRLVDTVKQSYTVEPMRSSVSEGSDTPHSSDLLYEFFPEYFRSKEERSKGVPRSMPYKEDFDFCTDLQFWMNMDFPVEESSSDNPDSPTSDVKKTIECPDFLKQLIQFVDSSGPAPDEKLHILFTLAGLDVRRIPAIARKYQNGTELIDVTSIYHNILAIYIDQNRDPGYIQGLGDLIIPFINIFMLNDYKTEDDLKRIEANTFICFNILLQTLEDDIQSLQLDQTRKVMKILEFRDPILYGHLGSVDMEYATFMLDWLSTAFLRSFDLRNWYLIFDSLISRDPDEIRDFLVYFSIALIERHKEALLKIPNNIECMVFLKHILKQKASAEEIMSLIRSAQEIEYSEKTLKSL